MSVCHKMSPPAYTRWEVYQDGHMCEERRDDPDAAPGAIRDRADAGLVGTVTPCDTRWVALYLWTSDEVLDVYYTFETKEAAVMFLLMTHNNHPITQGN